MEVEMNLARCMCTEPETIRPRSLVAKVDQDRQARRTIFRHPHGLSHRSSGKA